MASRLGARAWSIQPLAGGDTGDAFRLDLTPGPDGQTQLTVFVKTTRGAAPPGLFQAEADGLRWLAATGTVTVPPVLAVEDDGPSDPGRPDGGRPDGGRPRFLVLGYLGRAAPAVDHDERLGRDLARLHLAGAPCFGLDRDNFVGPLAQDNRPVDGWAEFYATRRLEPLTRRAIDAGRLPASVAPRLDALIDRLPDLVGPLEPPSPLHGDLWAGNAVTDERGAPVLVDPAVYGGHREVDLAMMQLFGGFGRRMFESYDETYPRAPGHHDRVVLYQLYPLLVHVNLFGGSYGDAVGRALDRYVGR